MTTIVSAAIILNERNQILIAQRPPGSGMEGYWEFPGGKVEEGEDPKDALVRECEEELGVRITIGRIYESLFVDLREKKILLLFYICRILEGEPESKENNPFLWADSDDLEKQDIIPTDLPLLERLKAESPEYRTFFKGISDDRDK